MTIRGHLPFITLALALSFSALAAGGIHLPVLVTYAVLVIASGVLLVFSPGDTRAALPGRASVLVGVALALALFCLLQALPLPFAWLEALAPRNADIWARSLKPLQEAGSPADLSVTPLSLAPGRSLIEALQLASYAIVFGVSARVGREHGMQRIALLAFSMALAVATVTAAHQLVGADRLYGQYQPLSAYSVAPLLNPNNRAGYLNVGFFCGLGLLFRSANRPYLVLVVLGLCVIAAEVLLCASTGGTTCLLLGWGLALLLLLPRGVQRSGRRGLHPLAQAGILLAIGGAGILLALAGPGSATLGVDARAWGKVELWRRALALAQDHAALGVGRGAFGSVFPAYQEPGKNLVFDHAESFPIQWAAEWGMPVTAMALLVLAWALLPIFSRETLHSPTRRCALIGGAVLLLQNLADLALELPAVAALLCCVLGGLLGSTGRNAEPEQEVERARWLLPLSAALACACLGLSLRFGSDALVRERRALYDELERSGPAAPSFWAGVARAVHEYPAEPYFPLLAASAALGKGINALPWISRALERSPHSPQAHLQLARILHARGATAQAFGALRRAIELEPMLVHSVPTLAREWKVDLPAFEAAAPLGKAAIPLLIILAERVDAPQLRFHLLEEALLRDPDAADAHYQLALELLQDVQRKEAGVLCASQRAECLRRAFEHTQRGATPGSSRTIVLEARLLAEERRTSEAEALLSEHCPQFRGDVKCMEAWLDRALRNDSPQLQTAINALVAAGCSDAETCARTHIRAGDLLGNAGRWHSALGHYQHATLEASSPEAWQAVARAAARMGDENTAADARRRVEMLARVQAPIEAPAVRDATTLNPPPTLAAGGGSGR